MTKINFRPSQMQSSPSVGPYATSVSSPLRIMFFFVFLAALFPLSIDVGVLRLYTLDLILLPLTYVFFVVILLSRRRIVPSWSLGEKLLFAMLVIMVVGMVFSVNLVNSLDGVLVWLRCIVLYIMLRVTFASKIIELRHWSWWWSILGIFLLTIGIIQAATGSQFGLVENYFGSNTTEQTYFLQTVRVSGTTANSNIYGLWIVIFSTLINARLLLSPKARLRSYIFLVLAVSIELWVLLATLSRGSLITFLVAHAVLLFMWIRSSRGAAGVRILASSLLLSAATAVGVIYYNKVNTLVYLTERLENNGDSERIAMIHYGLELLSYPKVFLLGTGMQAFFPTLVQYGIGTLKVNTWQDFSDSTTGIHNIFLLLFVESGIFVLFCFAIFYFSTIVKAFKLFLMKQGGQGARNGPWVAYLLIITLTLLVPMQLYNNVATLPILIFVLSICAIVNGLYSEARPTLRRYQDSRRQVQRWT